MRDMNQTETFDEDGTPPEAAGVVDLSILVISWNTLEMTRDCLASVMERLGGLSAEVILVDNASSDGSAEMVAAEFPTVRLIRNADNRGFAAANNQAMAVARGRYLLLLNSDTIVHGDVLSDSLAYMEAQRDVGVMGCRVLNADGSVQLTCAMYPHLVNLMLEASGLWKLKWPRFLGRHHMTDWQRDSEREVEMVSGCYMLVRREVVEQVGMLDQDFFFFGEETDWCRRISNAGWKLVFAPVGEITHYGGGSAKKLSHKRDVMLSQAIVRLHRKHGGLPSAAAAFAIIVGLNGSRAVFWTLTAPFRGPRAAERARHFRGVFRDSLGVWPGARG